MREHLRIQQFCLWDGTPVFLPRETKIKTHLDPEVSAAGGGDRARTHLWGCTCPSTPKAGGTVGLSAQGWSLSILTLSPAPPPGDSSGRGRGSRGRAHLGPVPWRAPAHPHGPTAAWPSSSGVAGSGRWDGARRALGEQAHPPLSASPSPCHHPPPQVLWVPAPLGKAGNPQAC